MRFVAPLIQVSIPGSFIKPDIPNFAVRHHAKYDFGRKVLPAAGQGLGKSPILLYLEGDFHSVYIYNFNYFP